MMGEKGQTVRMRCRRCRAGYTMYTDRYFDNEGQGWTGCKHILFWDYMCRCGHEEFEILLQSWDFELADTDWAEAYIED